MVKSLSQTALLLASFSILVIPASASLVWRPGEGWSDENGSEVAASSSSDQLDLAHKLEAKGDHDNALKAYKTLVRRWPLAFAAPEAQFKIGKLEEDQADFLNAFKSFQKMVEKYPYSPYFTQALDEEFRIANLYLSGEPQKIWKIPMGPSMDKAISLFQQVIKNAPYGADAAQAQFNIGLAQEKQLKYLDAVDSYEKLMERYPTSELASNAQYQIGYAWMRSASNADYDQSAAQKAIDAFQDFIVKYPDSDKTAQAQENINKLSHRKTQGAYDIAKFYETQHNPRAAYIYYNEVLVEDSGSNTAALAKKRIQELRPIVEALPGGLNPASASLNVAANIPVAPVAAPDAAPDNTPPTPSTDPADTTLPRDPSVPGGVASSPDNAVLPPALPDSTAPGAAATAPDNSGPSTMPTVPPLTLPGAGLPDPSAPGAAPTLPDPSSSTPATDPNAVPAPKPSVASPDASAPVAPTTTPASTTPPAPAK